VDALEKKNHVVRVGGGAFAACNVHLFLHLRNLPLQTDNQGFGDGVCSSRPRLVVESMRAAVHRTRGRINDLVKQLDEMGASGRREIVFRLESGFLFSCMFDNKQIEEMAWSAASWLVP
jgi:hypothetical protein